MPLLSRASGSPALFDIRLDNARKNVIVLRGSPGNAASVLLTGKVVLSLSEPMSIKRISLKLLGKVRLHWVEPVPHAKNGAARILRHETPIFEQEWSNLELGSTTTEDSSLSAGNSSSNLAGLVSSSNSNSLVNIAHSASSTQLHAAGNASLVTHTLGQGNHEFAFESIVPGSIDESVEGVEGCFVAYQLIATIERGRFSNNLTCRKPVHIIRTLGPDVLELSQSVCIDNSWPKKVDYSISIPNKAIAVGSIVTVRLELTPQLKGLKLAGIKIWLTEQINLSSPQGSQHNYERYVSEHLSGPIPDSQLTDDVWVIDQSFTVPASLARVAQDCVIHSYIKIGHKLKFAVSLKNPDGHTSELRASLPVYVFISPNVPISSVTEEDPNVLLFDGVDTPHTVDTRSGVRSSELLDLTAPPNYEDHIYDRLWNNVAPANFDSPIPSGAATPAYDRSRHNSFDHHGATTPHFAHHSSVQSSSNSHINMAQLGHQPSHLSQLVHNLTELQLQRDSEDSATITGGQGDSVFPGLYHTNSGGSDSSDSSGNHRAVSSGVPRPPSAVHPRVHAPGVSVSGTSTPIHNNNDHSGLHAGATQAVSVPAAVHSHHTAIDHLGLAYSPEIMHLSPNMPSTPRGTSYANFMSTLGRNSNNTQIPDEMDALSRVPSYHTAVNSDSPTGTDEAPSYDQITSVINAAFANPSNTNRSAGSSTNLAALGSGSHYPTSSSVPSHSSSSFVRAASSATQLSNFFSSHSANTHSVSAGASLSALSSALNRQPIQSPSTSSGFFHFGSKSKSGTASRSESRAGSRSNSNHSSRSNSRANSRSNSMSMPHNGGSSSSGSNFNGLSMTAYPRSNGSSASHSGAETPAEQQQQQHSGPQTSSSSGNSSLANIAGLSHHSNSSQHASSPPAGVSGSSNKPAKSRPTSGTSTPMFSASHRTHSSRSLISEATKLLHLSKLTPATQK